ncbi:MAG: hypothetical protein QOH41_1859 [Blastocatellia bacterium]|nr:hypothetical protein [Blastocatellia bacterium]
MAGKPKLDYRLRPAKSIERKMLAESFRRLSPFGSVDLYRYVGFGALYFSDFLLFHKLLGFKHMLSIQKSEDADVQSRFEYNRPFEAVTMKFGHSNTVLPGLPWDVRSIVWLDYEGGLDKGVLTDVATVASKVTSGSVLLVTVNASVPKASSDETEGGPKTAIDALERDVGKVKVPTLESRDLAGWGTAGAYRSIIDNQIEETLKERNGILSPGARMKYSQLFNFHYSDGAKMLTVGGLFFDEAQEANVSSCGFNHLEFYRNGEESYFIDPPLLTFREMRALEQHLPLVNAPTDLPISDADMQRFDGVYRYFPYFAETEL